MDIQSLERLGTQNQPEFAQSSISDLWTRPFGLNHRFSRKSRFRSPFSFLQPCRIIIRFIHKAPSSDLRACNTRRVIWPERRSGTFKQEQVLIKILNRFLIHFYSFLKGGSIKNFLSLISRFQRTVNSGYWTVWTTLAIRKIELL